METGNILRYTAYGRGVNCQQSHPMKLRTGFWKALFEGLAAPTMMYAPPPSYTAMIRDFEVGSSFAAVGRILTKSLREYGQG